MITLLKYTAAVIVGYLLHMLISHDKLVEKQGFILYVDTAYNEYMVETEDNVYHISSDYPLPEPHTQIIITTP
jgi:hypothetical protein